MVIILPGALGDRKAGTAIPEVTILPDKGKRQEGDRDRDVQENIDCRINVGYESSFPPNYREWDQEPYS